MPNQSDMNDRQILDCPNCPNQGWYVNSQGDQEQCQFCYCEPGSRFNYEASMRSDMNERKDMSTDYIDIVFDGPPSHEAGRFVEVENSEGKSIKFGEWVQRPDGYWVLRIPEVTALQLRVTSLEDVLRKLLSATEDTLKSHPETACCTVTRIRCESARSLLSPSGPQEA